MSDMTFEQLDDVSACADSRTPARPKAAAVVAPQELGEGSLPDEGTQDWHLLVTPGHVLGYRLLHVGRSYFLPAVASAIAGSLLMAAAVVGGAGFLGIAGAPKPVINALTSDPAHYAVLPGYTERGDYHLAWLSGAAGSPQRGLTEDGWAALWKAAGEDFVAHGDTVSDFSALPNLGTQATITRPEKLFAEHAGDLQAGVVALPKMGPGIAPATQVRPATAYVAAWVDGKLRIAALTRSNVFNQCRAILGHQAGCIAGTPIDFYALRPGSN